MDPRFSQLPSALRERTLITAIGADQSPFNQSIPALLAHPSPNWHDSSNSAPPPAPVCIWLHGRTANKELDPGRYLRWVRAGIAACAIDLPGHGERAKPDLQQSDSTLALMRQASREIDIIVRWLGSESFRGAFDTSRIAIGGMSAGGMAALIRLTQPHEFTCAAVEGTAGNFEPLRRLLAYDANAVAELNPVTHLNAWRPIPLLALHSEADKWIPFECMRSFITVLRAHYQSTGADTSQIEFHTWPTTGAPDEHLGFGRVSNDAKNLQTNFLAKHLRAEPPAD